MLLFFFLFFLFFAHYLACIVCLFACLLVLSLALQVFASELSKVVGHTPVRVRLGCLEVEGDYTERVKEWLLRLGF